MVDGVSRQVFNGVPPSLVRDGRVSVSSRPDGSQHLGPAQTLQISVSRVEAGLPPVDTARVNTIRSELAAGTYRVDTGRVADAMLADLERR